jgi:hypothetical protein
MSWATLNPLAVQSLEETPLTVPPRWRECLPLKKLRLHGACLGCTGNLGNGEEARRPASRCHTTHGLCNGHPLVPEVMTSGVGYRATASLADRTTGTGLKVRFANSRAGSRERLSVPVENIVPMSAPWTTRLQDPVFSERRRERVRRWQTGGMAAVASLRFTRFPKRLLPTLSRFWTAGHVK